MELPESEAYSDNKTLRPYACTYAPCHKSFSRRSDLVRHVRIHTNERPFKCDFKSCGKCFIQRSALTVHMRTHTGERPHVCEQCGRAFSDSSSLARHRRVHTGKRPYKCPFVGCGKTFCRKTTLIKHHKSHTDDCLSFSDNGSPATGSGTHSTDTSPSCLSSIPPQYAYSAYIERPTQNLSAPATSQTFTNLPRPGFYNIPPWSAASASFPHTSITDRPQSLSIPPVSSNPLQPLNPSLPILSPLPSPMTCDGIFTPHSSNDQPFPHFNPRPNNFETSPYYENGLNSFPKELSCYQDVGGNFPGTSYMDNSSFLASINLNDSSSLDPGKDTSTSFLFGNFPEPTSSSFPPIPLALSEQSQSAKIEHDHSQHSFANTMPQPSTSFTQFNFDDPLAPNINEINSCWARMNWNRS
ncbi:hypothetical protein BY996DRAFT_6430115 [Phakopsora pachyrhizi]|uniref:C2H2-type domain-containing protein n=1 Tax=Phakopsora pachyrhizi TaxID=170000 RepID=A0AAV0AE13_PHAPC|nr:hypothetical protein BY996DRAFT_6430115 [Phakopsora pachyrhizi]CAH7666094.1 hypothetical protein PPACK8108_LOCUS415 [Phakopsora pachyrhizi]